MTRQAPISILQHEFYSRETRIVAQELLGKVLVSELGGARTSGRIVETEAYLPFNDPACHAAKHRTPRTEVMFGSAGKAYVYPIHAKHCFNIVTEQAELGCAVLIRALEPTTGLEVMEARRRVRERRRLTTGPGCLCQALWIERTVNQHDLTLGEKIWLEEDPSLGPVACRTSVRIGVTSGQRRRLRFYVPGNEFVSGPKRLRN